MDAASIALMAKIARKEAGKIVPDKGERGPIGLTGNPGRDGIDGKHGVNGKDGRDGIDGKDGRDGKNGKDGADGFDGASWHLTFESPDEDFGGDGDFALDGKTSNIYHKAKGKWEFVVHLKAEVPQFQMQPPRAYSPDQIREQLQQPKVRYTAVDTVTTDDDETIVCTAELTVTLHTPATTLPTKPKRIKRAGSGDVTVTTVDASGYILNINYQAVDVQWTGTEWISL